MERITSFIKKHKTKIGWVVLTLVLAGVGALLSGNYGVYEKYQQPPLSPPAWLFPVAWSILYILMGVAAGMVAESRDLDKGMALKLYLLQLAVNIMWPIIFFRFNMPKFALFWLLLLIITVFITYKSFSTINKTAGRLLLPYILWCLFAFYLNFGIVVLNS